MKRPSTPLAAHLAGCPQRVGDVIQTVYLMRGMALVSPNGERVTPAFDENGLAELLGWTPAQRLGPCDCPKNCGHRPHPLYDEKLHALLLRLADEGWRIERPRPRFVLLKAAAGWGQVMQEVEGALSLAAHWGCQGVWPEDDDGPAPQAPDARYESTSRGLMNWTASGTEEVPFITVRSAALRALGRMAPYQSARRGTSALIAELDAWIAYESEAA
jgi:hypothetical protein